MKNGGRPPQTSLLPWEARRPPQTRAQWTRSCGPFSRAARLLPQRRGNMKHMCPIAHVQTDSPFSTLTHTQDQHRADLLFLCIQSHQNGKHRRGVAAEGRGSSVVRRPTAATFVVALHWLNSIAVTALLSQYCETTKKKKNVPKGHS